MDQMWCFLLKEEYTILRLEHTLGVFDNWLRKKILGPKGDRVIGLRDLYKSPKIMRVNK
jgi:hypothetical protein